MNREIKDLGASVHARLLNKARESKTPFNVLLQNYANERFLYRLSRSEHRNEFVLKGGLMFMGWRLPLRRHTRDIDLHAYTGNNTEEILQIVRDVCNQPVSPDAIEFNSESATAETILQGEEQPGIRVKLRANIGRTRIPLQIDMGFSDEITPQAQMIQYPAILDMPAPELYGYPKETFVAEKLHALVFRGSITSRRKDFYDLWFISRQFDFNGRLLQKAMVQTFNNRNTVIPKVLPATLTDEYAKDNHQQWLAFLRTFDPDFPGVEDFGQVISALRKFLFPLLAAAAGGKEFNALWNSSTGEWSKTAHTGDVDR